jgi:protein ImuB
MSQAKKNQSLPALPALPDLRALPAQLFACLYRPADATADASLVAIAQEFSPRYERHHDGLVTIDVSGLERLLGTPRHIAHELRREAADRRVRVHVAIAGTRMASIVLAFARPGVTVVDSGGEAAALAPIALGVLEKIYEAIAVSQGDLPAGRRDEAGSRREQLDAVFKAWGIRTLGELASLPPADLVARLGQQGRAWQAVARGADMHPLVPTLPDEQFESSLELEWPIEGLEPLSFVLTRLIEPLAIRLERRDRGVAILHVRLRLVTKALHERSLELPAPIRDVRTLRTLALIDLESHPPPAAIDCVTVAIDPTPGRVLQHTLFAPPCPTPDEISTLLARLGALMGQDRMGAPATVDTYRPGAFAMQPFSVQHADDDQRDTGTSRHSAECSAVLRRYRRPVAARVALHAGRPVRVTTDRRGIAGGAVIGCAGPWRTSGHWWEGASGSGRSGKSGGPGGEDTDVSNPQPTHQTYPTRPTSWNHDEWDVALSDGAVYRIFRDRETDGWFIDGIVD